MTFSQVSSFSKISDYEYKYFSDETKLLELVQTGPVATWFDVGAEFQFYGGGVYYSPEVCSNYEEEAVTPECAKEGGGYTCLGECKDKLPQHCDRCCESMVAIYGCPSEISVQSFEHTI